jgi:hypothetical protein
MAAPVSHAAQRRPPALSERAGLQLLIGSNVLNMSAWDFETYTNTEVIAVDQDSLGIQGRPIYNTCPSYTPGSYVGARAAGHARGLYADVMPYGRGCAGLRADLGPPAEQRRPGRCVRQLRHQPDQDRVRRLVLPGAQHDLGAAAMRVRSLVCSPHAQAVVRDLWAHQDVGTFSEFAANVGANGASATYRFKRQ